MTVMPKTSIVIDWDNTPGRKDDSDDQAVQGATEAQPVPQDFTVMTLKNLTAVKS